MKYLIFFNTHQHFIDRCFFLGMLGCQHRSPKHWNYCREFNAEARAPRFPVGPVRFVRGCGRQGYRQVHTVSPRDLETEGQAMHFM